MIFFRKNYCPAPNKSNTKLPIIPAPNIFDFFSGKSFVKLIQQITPNPSQHAIVIPLVLALIAAPFVIMRAAMMELDCFIARKKELEDNGPGTDEVDAPMVRIGRSMIF